MERPIKPRSSDYEEDDSSACIDQNLTEDPNRDERWRLIQLP